MEFLPSRDRIKNMLEAIAIIFLLLWALGLATAFTMGGFIHIFIVLAVTLALIRVLRYKKRHKNLSGPPTG